MPKIHIFKSGVHTAMNGTFDPTSFSDVKIPWSLPRVFRNLRDWFIDQHELETADKVIPDWNVKDMDDAVKEQHQAEQSVLLVSIQYKKTLFYKHSLPVGVSSHRLLYSVSSCDSLWSAKLC